MFYYLYSSLMEDLGDFLWVVNVLSSSFFLNQASSSVIGFNFLLMKLFLRRALVICVRDSSGKPGVLQNLFNFEK